MKTYIALLRGINVAGQKKIKMADLRGFLSELPFQNIQTYIQSGNIIFESLESEHKVIERKINKLIAEKYGFDVPVIVKKVEEFINTRDANPFFEPDVDISKLYIVFLDKTPQKDQIDKLNQYCLDKNIEDIYEIRNKEIHVQYSEKGYGRSKLNNNLFERILELQATTRNWKTLNKLIELASKP